MKKIIFVPLALLIIITLGLLNPAKAQDYSTGIGLRGGPGYGVTIKHFTSPDKAVEGIISPLWEGIMVTALYEKHAPLFKASRLNYYGGIGFHGGYWDYSNKNFDNNPWVSRRHKEIIAGMDLILGIEYTFKALPFSIGADWKPMLNLINDGSLWYKDIAISLRFIPGNM